MIPTDFLKEWDGSICSNGVDQSQSSGAVSSVTSLGLITTGELADKTEEKFNAILAPVFLLLRLSLVALLRDGVTL